MIKKLFSVLFFIFVLIYLPTLALASSVKEVLMQPDKFDGKFIEVEGEVVGELLKADNGAWINITSEGYNIGIFSQTPELFEEIDYWGDYKNKGDYIKVSGVFNKNCLVHNIRDIHAGAIKILNKGYKRQEIVEPFKIKTVITLLIVCLVLGSIYLIKLRYGK